MWRASVVVTSPVDTHAHYDVAVIGGGPSGAVTAALLAQHGARVVVFDPSHPREKPCGGGVTQRALRLLETALGVSDTAGVLVRTACFLDSERERAVRVALEPGTSLVVTDRTAFDETLLACASRVGVSRVSARVADLEPHAQGIRVSTSDGTRIAADFVIGADGPNSLVRRRLSKPFERADFSIATGVYVDGVTSDEIVLEMVADPPGYIWSFPRADHLAIGICAQASDTTKPVLQARLLHWLKTSALHAQVARASAVRNYSWPIPSLTAERFERTRLGGDRWLTVGDAAGLVDPITREGIFFAIQSGIFAAHAVIGGTHRARAGYDQRVRAEIIDDLSVAASLKARFFTPAFSALLTDALDASERIRSVMADLVAGAQPYRTLKRRLLGTLEVGLAWRLLRQHQRSA